MMWIQTTDGAVNSSYVVQIIQDADGSSILHLASGNTVRSTMSFQVIDGKLTALDPNEDAPF